MPLILQGFPAKASNKYKPEVKSIQPKIILQSKTNGHKMNDNNTNLLSRSKVFLLRIISEPTRTKMSHGMV